MAATTDDASVRAESLAAAGDVAGAVRCLVAAGRTARATEVVDDALDELVARFQHATVLAAVEALPEDRRSLPARLALADARLFRGETETGALQDLLDEAGSAGDHELVGLATSLLAEHLLVHADPSGVFLAAGALDRMPDGPLERPGVLVARARLRRVTLAARILLAPNDTGADAELVACIEDYRRAGRHTDRWLTTALCLALRAAGTWDARPGDRQAVAEARDQLLAMGSPQAAWARWGAALMASTDGDGAAVRAEVRALRHGDPDVPAFPLLMATHLEVLEDLADAADAADDGGLAAAVRRLEELVATVRQDYPLYVGSVLVVTAHALLDAGCAADATQWFGRVGAYPAFMPHEVNEREVLRARLDLASGDPAPDDVAVRLDAALDGLTAHGTVAMAAGLALRTAISARRAGADALADTLVTRAEGLLPPALRTGRQRRWLAAASPASPLPDAAGPDQAPTPHRLRLLAPIAEVVVDGEARRPAPSVVRLLGLLAAAGRPLATEQLADLLWPEVGAASGRGRLKSAHHRLRGVLGPAADDLVRRDGDVWSVRPGAGWSVDLADFRLLAVGGPAERAAAVRLPSGFLWDAQFRYDDALDDLREPLRAQWLGLAAAAVADGLVPAEEVARRTRDLGLADDSG
jgi:hypothetical protein